MSKLQKFSSDLKIGQNGENLIANMLKLYNNCNILESNNVDSANNSYDLKILKNNKEYLLEVKTDVSKHDNTYKGHKDFSTNDTGNIIIEKESYGKAAGIFKYQEDIIDKTIFIYSEVNFDGYIKSHFLNVRRLKDYISNNSLKEFKIGDGYKITGYKIALNDIPLDVFETELEISSELSLKLNFKTQQYILDKYIEDESSNPYEILLTFEQQLDLLRYEYTKLTGRKEEKINDTLNLFLKKYPYISSKMGKHIIDNYSIGSLINMNNTTDKIALFVLKNYPKHFMFLKSVNTTVFSYIEYLLKKEYKIGLKYFFTTFSYLKDSPEEKDIQSLKYLKKHFELYFDNTEIMSFIKSVEDLDLLRYLWKIKNGIFRDEIKKRLDILNIKYT